MPGHKVLLGTNIISALLKGDEAIAHQSDASKEVYIAATVIGELQ